MTSRIFLSFLRHNVLYVALTFLVSLTFSTVFGSFVVSTDANRVLGVADIKDRYGDFDVIVGIDPGRVADIRNAAFVASVSTYAEWVGAGDALLFCDRAVFDTLALKVAAGGFPNAPGEVMIERSTATKAYQFTSYSDLVGRTVTVDGVAHTVSGVYSSAVPLYANVYVARAGDAAGAPLWAVVSYRDTGNVDAHMDALLSAAGLPTSAADHVYVNVPLMTTMGYGPGGRQNTLIYMSLLVVLLVALLALSSVILSNTLVLMVDRNLRAFGVFKALQSSIGSLVILLVAPVYVAVVLGVAGGFALSYALVDGVVRSRVPAADLPATPFPVRAVLIVGAVLVAAYTILSLVAFRRIARASAVSIIRTSSLASAKPPPRQRTRRLFATRSAALARLRLFRSMVGQGLGKGLAVVAGLSLVVVVNVSMTTFWAAPTPTNLVTYDYVLSPDPRADAGGAERVVSLLRRQPDIVTVYDAYETVSTVTIAKTALMPDAARVLSRSADFGNRLRDPLTNKVTLPVVILGYDDTELRRLGVGADGLGDDECVVYQPVLSTHGVAQVFVPDSWLSVKYDQWSNGQPSAAAASCVARYSVDALAFPADAPDYAPIVVVSLSRFEQMFPDASPAAYYLTVNPDRPDAQKQVLGVISGNSDLQVVDMAQQNADQAANATLAKLLFGFFITVTALFSIINVYSLFVLKLRGDAARYSAYIILGLRRSHLMAAFAAETGLYYVVGLAASYGGLVIATQVINAVLPTIGVNYTGTVPSGWWMIFQAGLLVVLLAVLARVFVGIGRLRARPHTIVAE